MESLYSLDHRQELADMSLFVSIITHSEEDAFQEVSGADMEKELLQEGFIVFVRINLNRSKPT